MNKNDLKTGFDRLLGNDDDSLKRKKENLLQKKESNNTTISKHEQKIAELKAENQKIDIDINSINKKLGL